MAKSRMIAKSCPKCDQQVAVASKSCKCGYSFFQSRRIIRGPSPKIDERRRTGRIRREKPNFYDSQQFDKKHKKRPRRPKQFYNEEKLAGNGKETTAIRAKRRQKKKEEVDGGFDMVAKLSMEKQELAATMLSEINRKIEIVQWKP